MTAVGKGTAKPRAPRTRPAAVPQLTVDAAPEANGFPVLRLRTSAGPGKPAKRVLLFSIDDTEYTMLAEPTASLALRYLDVMQGPLPDKGPDKAFRFAWDKMVGDGAYDALLNYEPLTQEQFAQVSQVVIDTLLGPLNIPKDDSQSGPPRSAG